MNRRTKWARFANKLLKIEANKKGMQISIKWNYLTNKMMAKHL